MLPPSSSQIRLQQPLRSHDCAALEEQGRSPPSLGSRQSSASELAHRLVSALVSSR